MSWKVAISWSASVLILFFFWLLISWGLEGVTTIKMIVVSIPIGITFLLLDTFVNTIIELFFEELKRGGDQ
jgi:hypothetical protein